MGWPLRIALVSGVAIFLSPLSASAHSFGPIYTLPLPFWMYAWGAAATVVLSFLAVVLFLRARPEVESGGPKESGEESQQLNPWAGSAALLLLLLTIATGWWGSQRLYSNLSMTLFWVLFLVGLPYLVAVFGDFYQRANPWRILTWPLAQRQRLHPPPLLRYARFLEHWPAAILLLMLIWLELFGRVTPAGLANALAIYSLIMVLGALVFGSHHWLQNAELFGVINRLLGRLGVFHRNRGRLHFRLPFTGLEGPTPSSTGLQFFLLSWLAYTAFDGLHQTMLFHRWFFNDLYQALTHQWFGSNLRQAYPLLHEAFRWWQSGLLIVIPFVYFALYRLSCGLGEWMAQPGAAPAAERKKRGSLAGWIAPSLIPIALVYHAAHYYTLLQTQGIKIIALASDPFGWGWNLFGTAQWLQRTIIPDTAVVWRTQLALIVIGHMVAVLFAHKLALSFYQRTGPALRSQIPMLGLMVAMTVFGLWILSLPTVNTS